MDTDYDEFGNYIGPELHSDDEPSESLPIPQIFSSFDDEDNDEWKDVVDAKNRATESMEIDVVLHEDKKYYPSAEETFGRDVETMVQEEDTQLLTEPIIAPMKDKVFEIKEDKNPETVYSKDYLVSLSQFPDLIRNISLVGNLHHGKSTFLGNLVSHTHKFEHKKEGKEKYRERYTDTHHVERDRGISIKAMPMSLLMADSKSKSYLVNILDTPGHVDFVDEVAASLRLSDGAVLVVDAVEGVMLTTERLIKEMMKDQIPFILVVNKIDRLILELKLPPVDAYHKLRHTIEEINTIMSSCDPNWESRRLSPELGNVCFASSQFNFVFSLRSFAMHYATHFGLHWLTRLILGSSFDIDAFAFRLWGDVYFDSAQRSFRPKPASSKDQRTFVKFILEPLYKLFGQILTEDPRSLAEVLSELGIRLHAADYQLDVKPLLRLILSRFFVDCSPFVDCCVKMLPTPMEGAHRKVSMNYTGPMDSALAASMLSCDPQGPLCIHVTKLYPNEQQSRFYALGRIMSGTVKLGQRLRVLGENYSVDDEEDMAEKEVTSVAIFESRYRVDVPSLTAGNWVLLGGVDELVVKTATLVDLNSDSFDDDAFIFRPLRHFTVPVLRVAVEPMNPTELPKMLDGLRKVNKSYPLVTTKVEESGEHVIVGTGEMYLDCVLHDLRKMYSDIEVKVSDPVVRFCETVVEQSSMKCFAETPNKKNKLTMIAESLERGLAEDIERGAVCANWAPKQLSSFFQDRYKWDILAARGFWAFGPEEQGPNVLLDDTLPGEVDKKALASVKDSIKQGFQWGTREGPLCDEPIRNVKFKIIDATLAMEAIYRGGGQIIPTTRRVIYSSFLMATPRLMEPVNFVEIQVPADCVSAVYTVLAQRRGHVIKDLPKSGSPLYTVKALLPVIDSMGFETDLRTHTQGQAFCQQIFDHWQIVPGDPLDTSIVLKPLEPSPAQDLAHDFMVKMRRRKGLSEDVSVGKYFDDAVLGEIAKHDLQMGGGLI